MTTRMTADAPEPLADAPGSESAQPGPYVAGRGPIRAELFGPERLRTRAAEVARASARVAFMSGRQLLNHIDRDSNALRDAHRQIAAANAAGEPVTGAAEWLLDNFHIITEALREVRSDLPPGYYGRLPKLTGGPLAGYPRVYWLALDLVAHTDSALEEGTLTEFIRAYQAQTPLTIGELWAVPIMLRLVLVENLSRLAEGVTLARVGRLEARRWVERYLAVGPGVVPDLLAPRDGPDGRRVVAVLEELRGGDLPRARIEPFEAAVREQGVPLEEWLRDERQRQAANVVSVSNSVTSLRLLSAIDWPVFYEATSLVTERLRGDPAGVFDLQDFATRDRDRQAVEVLARGRPASGNPGRDELAVCDRALALAERRRPAAGVRGTHEVGRLHVPPEAHVGYYLIGDGRDEFERLLGYRPNWHFGRLRFVRRHARGLYFGSLATVTVLVLGLLLAHGHVTGAGTAGLWLPTLIALVALLPASELAVGLVNHLVTKLVPPDVRPKLDFSRGVPPECATFVVIPTLLTSAEGAANLVERLEIHSLSSPDPQLRFALLTDWADAPTEHTPGDEQLVQAALAGVRELNRRYAAGGPPKFFLFHRRRLWNPSERVWMGWERKRGKLSEFNRLLGGATDTTYAITSVPPAEVPRVRFVITLDSDTQMPRDMAGRLIGILAHPLNRPLFDPARRRVVRGYSILQPRVSVSLTAARRSRFTRLLAGSAGIDPYTTATSDVYQDLFGLGTFTGKGIYDLRAFEAATGPAFPDNYILSHDLIEGNFARCALVSDIELIDELPARFNAFSKREHRWVRGDWQLLPWLGRRIPIAREGEAPAEPEALPGRPEPRPPERVPNVLPLVERWKVFDNLRRSLVPPALVAYFLLGWTVFPGAPALWTLVGLAVPFLPLVVNLPSWLWRLAARPWAAWRTARDIGPGALATAGQAVLQLAFLPHQAVTLVDAVGRTLARVLVTRRDLLEWETAAAAERRLGNTLDDFIRFMPAAPAAAVVGVVLVAAVRSAALPAAIPVLLLWFVAPALAYWISQPGVRPQRPLSAAERSALRRIARKTWDFFETFVGDEDNGLPPDNFQELPKGAVAHRTSPTNIGLSLASNLAAHDFGFASLPHVLDRTEFALTTLDRMEQYRGHLFNWYDTRTLAPLEPRYVSTVDSGNLFASLLVLRQGLLGLARTPFLGPFAVEGLADTVRLAEEGVRDDGSRSELLAGVEAIGRSLVQTPADLFAWRDRFRDLAAAVAKLDLTGLDRFGEAHRWLTRLAEQVEDRRAELDAVAPWLDPVAELQAGGHRPPDAEGWAKLIARLGRVGSVCDLAETAAAAADELTARAAAFEPAAARDLCLAAAAACRASTAGGLASRCDALADHADRVADAMDFRLLYNPSRHLFSIGLNLRLGQLDASQYDLLASESALTSFLCIARGDAHRRHWFQLGRPVTRVRDSLALVSWGGTMFEYLMPRLYLRTYPHTLLDESRHSAVERQIDYGRDRGVPWGISESGYNFTDADGNYQYMSFGVPGLGLKRGLERDLVIAPYATVMAVLVRPHEAVENFAALAAAGGEGRYGFYEAIDYTRDRVPEDRSHVVVKSYMAHHQAMGFLSLANVLLGDPFPRRLHAEPMVRATELLLQERVPWEAPLIDVTQDTASAAAAPAGREGGAPVSRRITTPDTALPRTHLISNGEYTVLLTNAGGGRSTFRDQDVTRWRADRTRDEAGNVVYVRDLQGGEYWAAGHQPVCRPPKAFEAVFAIDKADFRRRDGDFETHLEVTVSTEHPAEVRRVTVTNHDDEPREVELTSYVELVMQTHNADLAHPAFVKLFLETEYLPAFGALLVRRRPRAPGERPLWAVHVAAVDGAEPVPGEFDTDRATVVGRGRTTARPACLDVGAKLAGRTGAVLDPVFCLRRAVRIPAGAAAGVTFTTAVAETREEAIALADRHRHAPAVVRAFELAWAHGPVELKHLNVTAHEAHLFQRLAGQMYFPGPALRAPAAVLRANRLAQDGLWRHGISGDYPIVLVTVGSPDDLGLVRQLLLAHTFWRHNGLKADLVVLNEKPSSYYDEFVDQLQKAVRASPARDMVDQRGGVFVRRADAMTEDERVLLRTTARAVLSAADGGLEQQLDRQEQPPELPPDWVPEPTAGPQDGHPPPDPPPRPALLFDNGHGGFTPDGREYVITVAGRVPPMPWSNVIANAGFGCLVTESSLGCTWAGNSQTNRLTPWSNDPVVDPPGEAVYLRDDVSGEFWTPTPNPLGRGPVMVRHGQGYTAYEQDYAGLAHELTVFVPTDDPVKLVVLKLANRSGRPRKLSVAYYAEWVLGRTHEETAQYVVTEVDATSGALFARNAYRFDFGDRVAFADVLHRPRTVTADRTEFLGRNRSPVDPAAMHRQHLSGRAGPGLDPCAALQVAVELDAGAEREVLFVVGETTDPVAARALVQRYREPGRVHDALTAVRRFWDDLCGAVQVKTPDPALDLMLNRWLPYQVLACRFWGRTAFYQSSGAFGFRDQIQDVLALVYTTPHLTREHLVRTAGRQFAAGDVQHWWHPPGGGGVRTRCSDDRLWLPYIALHYLAVTGDASLLDESAPFLDAPPLRPGQEDSYISKPQDGEVGTFYEHCARAIDVSLEVGPHGLPLIGTCDWNDGMNRVGDEGRGESVWLAWFQVAVLPEFAAVADARGDGGRAQAWRDHAERVRRAAEEAAWDGDWYRRAYFDDGTPLGSRDDAECQIDSLPQTWAVMCGRADRDRAAKAMDAVWNDLVRPDDRLVRLFTPPFVVGNPNPGYVAGYVPGIRENGGQYTHAATWVVPAYAGLGHAERAVEALALMNPVLAAATPDGVRKYKTEPYALCGDVYDNPQHRGRGGWSWYTGSAGWYYRVALESILGLEVRGDRLAVRPCIPAAWPGFTLTFRYRSATYTVCVERGDSGRQVWLDGERTTDDAARLTDDGREHKLRVVLG